MKCGLWILKMTPYSERGSVEESNKKYHTICSMLAFTAECWEFILFHPPYQVLSERYLFKSLKHRYGVETIIILIVGIWKLRQSLNNLSGSHSDVKPDPTLKHQGICLARKPTAWDSKAHQELENRCGSWLEKGEIFRGKERLKTHVWLASESHGSPGFQRWTCCLPQILHAGKLAAKYQ